jgi:predicted transcriptional regulator
VSEDNQPGLVDAVPEAAGQAKWIIPYAIGLDKLDLIVKASYQLRADSQAVDGERIASTANINLATTTSNLGFLVAIGILTPDKSRRAYLLTLKGKDYAGRLKSGENEEASKVLKELLVASYLRDLTGYLELHAGLNDLTYENLFAKIKGLARVKENEDGSVNDTAKAGIRCLMGLLIRAGFAPASIIQKPESGKAVQVSKKQRVEKESRVFEQEPGKRQDGNLIKINESGHESSAPFNINITIEARDAESIKQVMQLVKMLRAKEPEPDSSQETNSTS